MMKTICAWILAGGLLFSPTFTARAAAKKPDLDDGNYAAYVELFSQVLQKVQTNYVDTEKIQPGPLIRQAIKGMLESLDDRYTRLMEPEDYEDMQVKTKGKFGGVGMIIEKEDTAIRVVQPMQGTPAFEAGLQPGDLIVSIGKQATDTLTVADAADLLRGDPKTKVEITVVRGPETFKRTLTRDNIQLDSVQYEWVDTRDMVGYLKLKDFNEHSAREMKDALKVMDAQGMRALILDMRNNPGGLLDAAAQISDLFVDTGLLVYTRGRSEGQKRDFPAHAAGTYVNFPVVVVVNENTASGAEIVTGAIKDSGRGVVVGKKTFGKGVVQSVFDNLTLGYAITVTTANYYTPAGHNIHKQGIPPDIEVDQPGFSDNEREIINNVRRQSTILNFAKDRGSYTKQDVEDLKAQLKRDKMEISDEILDYLIKEQFKRKEGKNLVFHLGTDKQLARAYDIARTVMRVYNRALTVSGVQRPPAAVQNR